MTHARDRSGGGRLKKTAMGLALAVVLAGCAVETVQLASGRAFTGEVWTWDRENNTVTLRQGTKLVRVKVTPEQLVGLQPRQVATVRGEVAPPAEIPVAIVPTPPVVAMPTGPVDQTDVTGTVTAIDPNGRISVSSPRGRVDVWVGAGAVDRLPTGSSVRLRTTVQRFAMVAASGAPLASASPASEPAPMAGEPGDYAAITGRVLRVEPAGIIAVESPRGPIDVLVGDSSRYRVGDRVEVRTSVQRAQ